MVRQPSFKRATRSSRPKNNYDKDVFNGDIFLEKVDQSSRKFPSASMTTDCRNTIMGNWTKFR